ELRIRAPEQWRGDFEAMLGAAWSGERDLLQLAREFGWDVLRAFVAQWLDYGEKRTRRIIAALPAGKGRATVFHDPMPGTPAEGVPVTATVTIDPEAGEIEVDLRDNLDCLPNGLNLTEATARTAGLIGIFNSIPGNPPKNAGTFRPLRVLLRDGCTVGVPTHPASCSSATTNLADRVAAATQIAIAGIAPDLGMAEVGAANAPAKGVISGLDPRSGRYVVNQLFLGSTGGGAHPRGDGWLTNSHAGNAGMSLVDSIELVELCHPLVIRERAIVPDSEGAGRTIGAPAMRVVMEVAVGEIELVYASDCSVHPARGVCGGADAHAAGQQCVRRGKLPELLSNIGRLRLEAGDAIISIAAGGGGYGNPRERPAHLVARDVAAGLISAERARDVYGVPRNAANQEV
ncbi:MAG: hydantoinase B/oxoprolinase family protein, partial [Variibacter sp.]|nr:hydantoinase B/oxoprolinase family protein [Variibacter sp.]